MEPKSQVYIFRLLNHNNRTNLYIQITLKKLTSETSFDNNQW